MAAPPITPQTFRPIPKVDAERILDAIDAAGGGPAPADASAFPGIGQVVPGTSTPTVVAIAIITPQRNGSRLHCIGTVSGSRDSAGETSAFLHIGGHPMTEVQGALATDSRPNSGAACLNPIASIPSPPAGTPITIELVAVASGAAFATAATPAGVGIGLLVEEVGGS
jgi:hypothetical protein